MRSRSSCCAATAPATRPPCSRCCARSPASRRRCGTRDERAEKRCQARCASQAPAALARDERAEKRCQARCASQAPLSPTVSQRGCIDAVSLREQLEREAADAAAAVPLLTDEAVTDALGRAAELVGERRESIAAANAADVEAAEGLDAG